MITHTHTHTHIYIYIYSYMHRFQNERSINSSLISRTRIKTGIVLQGIAISFFMGRSSDQIDSEATQSKLECIYALSSILSTVYL